jgi:CHAT domain-containing protein/tetratricopeptide (TPR) repeat protein
VLIQRASCLLPRGAPKLAGPALRSIVWLTAALGIVSVIHGQESQTAAPSALKAGETRELTLEPGHAQRFAVTVPAGRMAVLTLDERLGMSEMMASSVQANGAEVQTPAYTSDGGMCSQVRLALLGKDDAVEYTVTFTTRERRRASLAKVSLSAPQAPGSTDLALAAAVTNYARAEAIRRGGGQPEWARGAALYDAAITEASRLGTSVSAVSNPIDLERRAWVGKARLLMYREENYLGAEQAAHRAVEIGGDNQNASLAEKAELGLAWKTYSSALALLNRYDEAVAAGQRAMALYKQTGDEYWQGVVVGNLAFVYRETGQTAKALEAAQESLKLAESQKDDYGRAFALSAEGAISQGVGDYQAALDSYFGSLDAVAALKKSMPNSAVEGEVWSNVGEIYANLGNWEQAENAYRHALPVLEAASDGVNQIEVTGELAEAEAHAGKLEAAEKDYRAAIQRAGEEGLLRQKTHLLTGLARTEVELAEAAAGREGDLAAANSLFEQAQAEALAIHQIDGEAEALAGLGDIDLMTGKRAEARLAYERSMKLWEQIPNDLEAARTGANLARLDKDEGHLDRARDEIFAALDQVERARATLASESLRTSYFSSRHALYELAVDVLMQLDARRPGQGYAAQAWVVAERARARTLLDELAGTKNSTLDARQKALEVHIEDTEDRLAHLGTTPADMVKAEAAGHELHELLLEADRAAQEARSRRLEGATGAGLKLAQAGTPETETEKSLNGAVARDEALVNKALDDDAALYEYWAGANRSYLWVIRPGAAGSELTAYVLPGEAELRRRVDEFMDAVLARERAPENESEAERERSLAAADRRAGRLGEELGELLFPAPARDAAGELRRMVIVPDGPLEELSYAALRIPENAPGPVGQRAGWDGSAAANRESSYLVQRYGLVEEPSAGALIELARTADSEASRRSQRVAVFADPVYSRTDPRLSPAVADAMAEPVSSGGLRRAGDGIVLPQLARLPGSKREAMDIRNIAGAQDTSLFLNFDATPAALAGTDWSQYRVLHIAAHAFVNEKEPELSGIALSMLRPDGTAVNGVVRLHDVYRLHTPVQLVVLSACSTWGGKSITGEGMDGLARAFLVAGSRSVLAMQWGADDDSTSELMRAFYSGYLRGGEPSPAALRAAQIGLMQTPRYAAPYYWAGAVLEGSWQGR